MNEPEQERPTPGSDAAIERGCTCPILDNGHGRGFMGIAGRYVIVQGCPLHDPREKRDES